MLIKALAVADRAWAAALVEERFGSPTVVSRAVLHDTRALPGLVVLEAGERCGLLQYRSAGGELEVVVVIACRPRRGIGRRLLETVEEVAREQGCRRLWLSRPTTTGQHLLSTAPSDGGDAPCAAARLNRPAA